MINTTSLRIQQFAYNIIYWVLWIIEAVLLVRFFLRLFGANPFNEIVAFVYSVSSLFMGPFRNVFGISVINNMVLEPSTLVAMVFYAVVAYILVSFLRMLNPNTPTIIR